jgi:16S rRNA processing protein RimM
MTPDSTLSTGGYIAIAAIRKPLGLQGWCAVTALGNTLARLKIPTTVMIGRSEAEARTIVLEKRAENPKGYRCLFEGVADCNAAEKLRDNMIFIQPERIPKLDKNEYFHFELVGMAIVAADDNRHLGVVEEVNNYPTVDALDVRLVDGRAAVIPLTKESVVSVDREQRRISISPAECEELL